MLTPSLLPDGHPPGRRRSEIRQAIARSTVAILTLFLAACAAPGSVEPSVGGVSQLPTATPPASAPAKEPSGRFTPRPLGETGPPLGYYEYLPPGYGDGEPRPLLVFVHGIGESGDGSEAELDRLLATAIPELIRADRWPDDRPFVVLAPQHDEPVDEAPYAACEQGETWGPCVLRLQHELGHPTDGSLCMTPTELDDFLTYAIATYDVDRERVYLTGLSCGAYASFEYAAAYGARDVAAMVVIAGEGRPAWEAAGCELGQVPIWGFHGDADSEITAEGTVEPISSLMDCPAPPRRDVELTIYPGVDHDSWTRTYDGKAGHDIYEWLLGFSLP
jgi:predicted peptidase